MSQKNQNATETFLENNRSEMIESSRKP